MRTLPLVALSIWVDVRCPVARKRHFSGLVKALAVGIPTLEYIQMGSKDYFSFCPLDVKPSSTWYRIISRVDKNSPEIERTEKTLGRLVERQLLDIPRL